MRGNVLFLMFMEHSHVASTFGVASDLQERGLKVLFLCNPSCEQLIASHQFESIVVDMKIPYNEIPCSSDRPPPPPQIVNNPVMMWIVVLEKICLRSTEFRKLLLSHDVDFLAVDEHLSFAGLVAYELAIPVATVATALSSHYYHTRPYAPPNFYLPPFNNLDEQSRFEQEEWALHKQFYKKLCATRVDFVEKFVQTARYPLDQVSDETTCYPWLRLFPNLILVSKHFQYQRSNRRLDNSQAPEKDTELYCGPCLDMSAFKFEQGNDSAVVSRSLSIDSKVKKLVVVSFGSQNARYALLPETLKKLVDFFAIRPNLTAIFACGDFLVVVKHYIDNKWASVDNIECKKWIDQKKLLSMGASLLITHGGMLSIKEAIYYRVPLLVIPQAFDQFGNAARVNLHGIGTSLVPDVHLMEKNTGIVADWVKTAITPHIRESTGRISSTTIESSITKLLGDPEYKRKITEMSQKCALEQVEQLAANFIVEKIKKKKVC